MDQIVRFVCPEDTAFGTNFTAYVNDARLLQGRNGRLTPKKKKKTR